MADQEKGDWDKLDLANLVGRLEEVKSLIAQAAAIAAAQDRDRVAQMTKLQTQNKEEEGRVNPGRRRYR